MSYVNIIIIFLIIGIGQREATTRRYGTTSTMNGTLLLGNQCGVITIPNMNIVATLRIQPANDSSHLECNDQFNQQRQPHESQVRMIPASTQGSVEPVPKLPQQVTEHTKLVQEVVNIQNSMRQLTTDATRTSVILAVCSFIGVALLYFVMWAVQYKVSRRKNGPQIINTTTNIGSSNHPALLPGEIPDIIRVTVDVVACTGNQLELYYAHMQKDDLTIAAIYSNITLSQLLSSERSPSNSLLSCNLRGLQQALFVIPVSYTGNVTKKRDLCISMFRHVIDTMRVTKSSVDTIAYMAQMAPVDSTSKLRYRSSSPDQQLVSSLFLDEVIGMICGLESLSITLSMGTAFEGWNFVPFDSVGNPRLSSLQMGSPVFQGLALLSNGEVIASLPSIGCVLRKPKLCLVSLKAKMTLKSIGHPPDCPCEICQLLRALCSLIRSAEKKLMTSFQRAVLRYAGLSIIKQSRPNLAAEWERELELDVLSDENPTLVLNAVVRKHVDTTVGEMLTRSTPMLTDWPQVPGDSVSITLDTSAAEVPWLVAKGPKGNIAKFKKSDVNKFMDRLMSVPKPVVETTMTTKKDRKIIMRTSKYANGAFEPTLLGKSTV